MSNKKIELQLNNLARRRRNQSSNILDNFGLEWWSGVIQKYNSQTLFFQENKFNIHKERGFTLIEVLISIFVLSIGIFGVMALFPVGIHQTGKIAKNTIGAISAETPLAYAWYKYPASNTNGIDYDIRDIVTLISGTTTPACYFYPDTGTITISGNVSYGWNTSLVPVDMDSNGTSTTIGETYLFRQQTAIYKNYTTNSGAANFCLQ